LGSTLWLASLPAPLSLALEVSLAVPELSTAEELPLSLPPEPLSAVDSGSSPQALTKSPIAAQATTAQKRALSLHIIVFLPVTRFIWCVLGRFAALQQTRRMPCATTAAPTLQGRERLPSRQLGAAPAQP
jgi:hypothetical protein